MKTEKTSASSSPSRLGSIRRTRFKSVFHPTFLNMGETDVCGFFKRLLFLNGGSEELFRLASLGGDL